MASVQQSILDDLRQLGEPLSQMEYLLACARAYPGIPAQARREENLVPSCQARTWVTTCWEKDILRMTGDSESFLVKGALALLCELYDGRSREEIASFRCTLLEDDAFRTRFTQEQQKGLRSIIAALHRQAAGAMEEG